MFFVRGTIPEGILDEIDDRLGSSGIHETGTHDRNYSFLQNPLPPAGDYKERAHYVLDGGGKARNWIALTRLRSRYWQMAAAHRGNEICPGIQTTFVEIEMTKPTLPILFLAVFTCISLGQENEKKYEIREINGVKVRVFVPSSDEDKRSSQLAKLLFKKDYYQRIGLESLLERVTSEELDGAGALDYQTEDAIEVVKSYRTAMSSATTLESKARILVENGQRLEGILLPEQLELLKKETKSRSFFRRLNTKKAAEALELTKRQREDILNRCETANKRIEFLVAQFKKETDVVRKDLLATYDKTLSKEQQLQFMRSADVEKLLKKMSILELQRDTMKAEDD